MNTPVPPALLAMLAEAHACILALERELARQRAAGSAEAEQRAYEGVVE
jgi:hypothetical protein